MRHAGATRGGRAQSGARSSFLAYLLTIHVKASRRPRPRWVLLHLLVLASNERIIDLQAKMITKRECAQLFGVYVISALLLRN